MKNISSLLSGLLLASFALTSLGQTTTQPQQRTTQPDGDEVVRISANLIQVDAVVTDKAGRPVYDLSPEEFEVQVNGRPQRLTHFSLITAGPAATDVRAEPGRVTREVGPPLAAASPGRAQVNRTIALVVDDLTLSLESAHSARSALKRFVDEGMRPGDLVAVVRVGSSIGLLQQFTSDKRQLYAAVERVRYNPAVGRAGAFTPMGQESSGGQQSGDSDGKDKSVKPAEDSNDFREAVFSRSAIDVTRYVVRGMRGLPGRKSVMLLSEGFKLDEYNREAIRRLVDSANRSAVTVYTFDARGLQTLGLNAADDVGLNLSARDTGRLSAAMSGDQIQGALDARRKLLLETQDSLIYLAEQTGGFNIRDTNDLAGGIRKALDEQAAYYLLGFQPEASTFDRARPRFNRLTIRVKRPGLTVRHRSGFFGVEDEAESPAAGTPRQQMVAALSSPFAASDLSLRLTALWGNDARAGSFVRALVNIPAADLNFTVKADGSREAAIDVLAYLFGDNGAAAGSVGESHRVTLTDKLYKRALSSGLVYSLNVPIRRAGAYQLRVAVRDGNSGKVGTAGQFVDIPDLGKDGLTLSGIALSSYDPRDVQRAGGLQQEGEAEGDSLLTQATLRRFVNSRVLRFAYTVYNAKPERQTGRPGITTQVNLYRGGREIFKGPEAPFDAGRQTDPRRLIVEGGLSLEGLEAGEYFLQVIVRDTLAKDSHRTAEGWVDFEIVK